jgi:gas vesicle protein
MSESTSTTQAKKQQKKDIGPKIEQWADTKDPFVNNLYKRLRNTQKKINKIAEVEQKIKAKEIEPN